MCRFFSSTATESHREDCAELPVGNGVHPMLGVLLSMLEGQVLGGPKGSLCLKFPGAQAHKLAGTPWNYMAVARLPSYQPSPVDPPTVGTFAGKT